MNSVDVNAFSTVINDDRIYHIVRAFRRPDVYAPNLDMLFSARIRYLAGIRDKTIPLRTLRYVNLFQVYFALGETRKEHEYYLDIVHDALRSLTLLGLMTETEYYFLNSLRTTFYYYSWGWYSKLKAVREIKETAIEYPDFFLHYKQLV